jgi:hypothetical protein
MTLSQHCRDCLYLGLDFINKRKYHINRIVEGTHVVESLHLSVLCPCVPVFTKDIYVVAKGLRHETRSRSKESGAAVSQGQEPRESSVPPPLLSRYAEYATAANGGSRSSPSTSRSRSTPRGFGSAARAFVKNIDFAQARIVHHGVLSPKGILRPSPLSCASSSQGEFCYTCGPSSRRRRSPRAPPNVE